MKKIVLLICAALLSIGAAAQVRAGQNNREIRRIVIDDDKPVRITPQINENLGRDLVFIGIPNLTDEQKTQLKDLQTSFDKENRRTNNLINEKRARLRTLQDEDNIDQKEVNKTIDEMTALQAEQMKAQVDYKIKARAILTPEQLDAYNRIDGRSLYRSNSTFRNNSGRFNVRRFPL